MCWFYVTTEDWSEFFWKDFGILVYGILENAKTYLYGNKADDVFETNQITIIFCNCPEMKIYGTLNKHPGFQQRYKMVHK